MQVNAVQALGWLMTLGSRCRPATPKIQPKGRRRFYTHFKPNFTFLFSTIRSQMYRTDRYRSSLMSCPLTLSNNWESAFLQQAQERQEPRVNADTCWSPGRAGGQTAPRRTSPYWQLWNGCLSRSPVTPQHSPACAHVCQDTTSHRCCSSYSSSPSAQQGHRGWFCGKEPSRT